MNGSHADGPGWADLRDLTDRIETLEKQVAGLRGYSPPGKCQHADCDRTTELYDFVNKVWLCRTHFGLPEYYDAIDRHV